MKNSVGADFVETMQYRLFQEFCDACRRDRYIGLCYGVPGVGKTWSAWHYAHWDKVLAYRPSRADEPSLELLRYDTVLYTPPVTTTPGPIARAIETLRGSLREPHVALLRQKEKPQLDAAQQQVERLRIRARRSHFSCDQEIKDVWAGEDTYREMLTGLSAREWAVKDPTALIIIDEADRLKVSGLEQVRAIFDEGGIGLVLIGMPGIEKRLARYPQLYSRVGFVHEFRPLAEAEVRNLLRQGWKPPGVVLPREGLSDEEALDAVLRITGGNFRLLHRLLTQIARVLQINELEKISIPVVEAARENLVIGAT
jgi:DNA transposition AAA+ family ATPase